MKTNSWSRRPEVEVLESLTLLSHAAMGLPVVGLPIEIEGTVRGSDYTTPLKNQGGENIHVAAGGRLSPFNGVAVSGSFQSPTLSLSGPSEGRLIIFARRGAVALTLTEPILSTPPAFSSNVTYELDYTITKASGEYRGDTGTGVVDIAVHTYGSFGGYGAGTATLTFTPTTATSPIAL